MKKLSFLLVMVMAFTFANSQAQMPPKAKASSTPVKVTDLPKAIIDNVAKDFAGFTIKDAKMVESNGVSQYDVIIVKGSTTETLIYDKTGKFIKKSESSSMSNNKKAPANSSAKPAPKPAAKR
jgi:hypothetical protein